MKNIIAIVALTATAAYSSYGQGEVQFQNGNSSKISVNSAVGGAATGLSAATGYYYALFDSISATTVAGNGAGAEIPTVNGAGSYAFSDANWTFDAYGTETSAGKFSASSLDSNGYTQIPGQPASAQFVVIGWSSNIGSTVSSLTSFLAGNGVSSGFVGESSVSGNFPTGSGATGSTSLPQILFSSTAPAIPGFTLGEYTVPEPTSIALAGLGGLAMLAFRRKKA